MRKTYLTCALCALGLVTAAALAVFAGYDPLASSAGVVAAMAVVQSSYSENIGVAYAGMIANMRDSNCDTRVCETTAGIGFGLAVGRGTADDGVVLGSSASTDFLGVTVRDVTLVTQDGQTVDKYQRYDNVPVLTEGDVWVAVGAAVVDGDNVSYVASTGVLSSAGTSGSQFAISGARWMTTQATVGGLAKLRLTGTIGSA